MEMAVDLESLVMKSSAGRLTMYTSDMRKYTGWFKSYSETNPRQIEMLGKCENGFFHGKCWNWHGNGVLHSIETHQQGFADR